MDQAQLDLDLDLAYLDGTLARDITRLSLQDTAGPRVGQLHAFPVLWPNSLRDAPQRFDWTLRAFDTSIDQQCAHPLSITGARWYWSRGEPRADLFNRTFRGE